MGAMTDLLSSTESTFMPRASAGTVLSIYSSILATLHHWDTVHRNSQEPSTWRALMHLN